MIALISLLIIISLSLLVTRVITVALTHTGLSREAAQFQATSAFTGVGFTTNESESIVNHPLRRRIILVTAILGNAGIVTTISSLIIAIIRTESTQQFLLRFLWLLLGLTGLWLAAISQWLDRHLSNLIDWALHRWSRLNVRDYARLLHVSGDYQVVETEVEANDWWENKALRDLQLNQEGILVLGIIRQNGQYLGAPVGDTEIHPADKLILYGREERLRELDERQAGLSGEMAHEAAKSEQENVLAEEQAEDTKRQQEAASQEQTS